MKYFCVYNMLMYMCMDVKPTQFDALFIYVQHSFVILLDVNARSSMLGEELMDFTGRYCRLIYVYLLCHMSRDLNYGKGSLYGAFPPDVFLLIRLGKR